MEFDFKTLLLLRENTSLDPVSFFKVLKERKIARDYQIIINKLEHCHLGVDYTKANQLEASMRFLAWKRDIFDIWLKYGNQLELDEFALMVLGQQANREKPKRKSLIK